MQRMIPGAQVRERSRSSLRLELRPWFAVIAVGWVMLLACGAGFGFNALMATEIPYPVDWPSGTQFDEQPRPEQEAYLIAILKRDVPTVLATLKRHPEWSNLQFATHGWVGSSAEEQQFVTTALQVAVWVDDLAMVTGMLDAGARTEPVDVYGNTALEQSLYRGGSEAIWEQLLRHGADVNRHNSRGDSPLMVCLQNSYWGDFRRPIQWLLDHGADANDRDGDGRSVVWLASHRNHGGLELFGAALIYPYLRKIPGVVQFLLFWLVIGGTVVWVVRRQRRVGLEPVEHYARINNWPTDWEAHISPEEWAQLPVILLRVRRYRCDRLLSLVPFVGGCFITLMVLADPVVIYLPTTVVFFMYAGLYIVFYGIMWWWAEQVLPALGGLYSALGVFFLCFQGWGYLYLVHEALIAAMYCSCAALLLMQCLLMARMSWSEMRDHALARNLRKRSRIAHRQDENTGIDVGAGSWDEGKS